MEIWRLRSKEEARQKAVDTLNKLFSIKEPILFLASGGSALELLEHLNIPENMTVSVLDERYSTDLLINNFSQLSTKIQAVHVIDTRAQEGETLEQFAERFEQGLRSWKDENPNGKIVITQGMGPDGHTSGIMPYPENPELFETLFGDPKRWIVGYDATGKNEFPLRATTTLSFLRTQVDSSIAYITGENKKAALERVLAKDGSLAETPARIMREMKQVIMYTDCPAT